MRNERTKQLLIGVLSCMLATPGCVSVRHACELGSNEFVPLQNYVGGAPRETLGFQAQRCDIGCEVTDLKHPTEMPIHGVQPLVPLRNAALGIVTGLKDGAGQVGSSLVGLKGKVQGHWVKVQGHCGDWQSKRKQKSNPPPWPKFHPVPAKPVFEAASGDMSTTPGTFGSFGTIAEE
jgi:hypothetical protein